VLLGLPAAAAGENQLADELDSVQLHADEALAKLGTATALTAMVEHGESRTTKTIYRHLFPDGCIPRRPGDQAAG
jgi:hypothetical protein